MGNFSQKGNFHQNIDYISRTLNTLESYQYLISFEKNRKYISRRGTENILADGNFFPKRKLVIKP